MRVGISRVCARATVLWYLLVSSASMKRYSLCKHGPYCSRNCCGFAHSISEIDIPGIPPSGNKILAARRWVDESHVSEGPPGIDYFFGQEYTTPQHERVLMYASRSTYLSQWVNMYLWFVGHPHYQLQSSIDFGWLLSVSEKLRGRIPGGDVELVRGIEDVLENWIPPFKYAEDFQGLTFPKRMLRRLAEGREYGIRRALRVFTEEECIPFRDLTSMHWGGSSRYYLSFDDGEQLVCIGQSTGDVGGGWVWVRRLSTPAVGWVSNGILSDVTGNVYAEGMPEGVYIPQETETDYIPVNVSARDLGCYAPDGTDLTVYNALAVCFSDGSVDDRKGIGVAAVCVFPRDISEWIPAGISARIFFKGSAAAELVGVCLNLAVLMQRPNDYENAVVYCDCMHVPNYVGDTLRIGNDPTSAEGRKLYPLIRYARQQVSQLSRMDKTVLIKHLPREYNPVDRIARKCMQSRRDVHWRGPEWNADRITSLPELVQAMDAVSECTRQLDRR